jgi:hypothetical protein
MLKKTSSVILVLSIRTLVRHLNHKTPDEQTVYHQTPIAKYKVGIYLNSKYQVTESLEVHDSGVLRATRSSDRRSSSRCCHWPLPPPPSTVLTAPSRSRAKGRWVVLAEQRRVARRPLPQRGTLRCPQRI